MSDRESVNDGPSVAEHLIGHGDAEAQLLRAIGSGRMHHAWLLTGPQGVGKATFAYRLAKFLLSGAGETGGLFGGGPDSLTVDPDSPAARQVSGRAHPSLQILELGVDAKSGKPRTVITVDQVREANHFLQMTAAGDGWRVVLVDAIDDMNRNAANAFLKKLEEPPPRTVFLLVNHAAGRILPTIRSRCRTLTFSPLPEAEVAEVIGLRLPEIGAEERAQLASLAEGSPGRALSLAAEGGLELLSDMLSVLETLPALDVAAAHSLAEKAGARGKEAAYATLTDLMGWWLARLVRGAGQGDGGSVAPLNPAETALRARLSAAAPLDRWAAMWEKTAQLFRQAAAINLDRKQVVLQVFMDLQATIGPAGSATAGNNST